MRRRKTVLFTTLTSVPTGGVNTREMHLARMLSARGWRVVFGLTFGNRFHDPFQFQELYPAAETILLDGRTGTPDGRWMAIRSAIARVQPDVVIPGALADTFEVVRQMKAEGNPIRLVWGMPGVDDRAMEFVRTYRGVIDQAFGVSRFTTQLLATRCGLPLSRIRYVPTGVMPARRAANLAHDGPLRLGYVGRFDDDKRPLDAIAVCRELGRRNLPFQMTMVGRGRFYGELEVAAASSPETARLRIVPPMDIADLYERVYPELDACLLFSPKEGMPNTLLEAMAHGVVPVTSDYLGRDQEALVEQDVTGMVFPVADISRAADQVTRLSQDVDLRRRLGAHAREAVSRRHSMEVMGDSFAAMLDHCLECPPVLGTAPPLARHGTMRLSRLVGPTTAEHLRRWFRRRFPHLDDDGEWPRISKVVPSGTTRASC